MSKKLTLREKQASRSCWIKTLELPLEENKQRGWRIYRIFEGSTTALKKFSSHISVLSEQITPHPLHRHSEEELIIVLSGKIELIKENDTEHRLKINQTIFPGCIIYHCAYQPHTIHNVGPGPATYLIFKCQGKLRANKKNVLESSTFNFSTKSASEQLWLSEGFKCAQIFESPTGYLRKLRSHLSILEPGAGYSPHRDPYDVAIVLLSGTVETLGRKIGPLSVIFYAANELHGMQNTSNMQSSYLVFEFHGPQTTFKGKNSQELERWRQKLDEIARKIADLIPMESDFILVDDLNLFGVEVLEGYRAFPFIEHEGQYWGSPADDRIAIKELERLRVSGARFIVFCWPALWWLFFYKDFHIYLRSHYACVFEDGNLVVFALR